jgi:chromosomal replication initiator protein
MENTKNEIWSIILKDIINEVKNEGLEVWFNSINRTELSGNEFKIFIPNDFYKIEISKKEEEIKNKLKIITGNDIEIKYELLPQQEQENEINIPVTHIEQPKFANNINPEYTFDNMVISKFNQFAASVCEKVVADIGKNSPLFIYSKPGLGKTHLLHAIGNSIIQNKPSARVIYITAENFVNEYIDSIKQNKMDSFRNKYRNLDCFLIDDIQFMVEKGRSEEEFFFTFNTLSDYKKQIVVTSDRSPNDINLNERLISRFKSGLVADIKPPEYEERMAILKRENEKNKFNIPQDIINFLAENIKDSIRSLKGCLSMIYHYSSYSKEYPTIDRTKEWIKDYLTINNKLSYKVNIEDIQSIVAQEYSITVDEIKSKQRSERLSFPRQIAIYIACEITDLSLPDIGKFFNKDHSTVIHARDKIKQLLNSDPFFSEQINDLINKIKNKNVD